MLSFLRRKPAAVPPRAAYRLRKWPELPDDCCTAAVFGSLSRMSLGPVSLTWFTAQSRLRPDTASALLERLVRQGSVEKIELMPLRGAEYAR